MPDITALPADERAKLGPVEATKYDILIAETARKKKAATEAGLRVWHARVPQQACCNTGRSNAKDGSITFELYAGQARRHYSPRNL